MSYQELLERLTSGARVARQESNDLMAGLLDAVENNTDLGEFYGRLERYVDSLAPTEGEDPESGITDSSTEPTGRSDGEPAE